MAEFMEIRWHGRGGQGTVTAAKSLAEAVITQGKYVQAFPEYGPERMGAPIRAYNRIGDEPIRIHCGVTQPGIVVIVDSSLIGTEDLTSGTTQETLFVVNTTESPPQVQERLGLGENKVFTVDASRISLDCVGKHLPNIPMLAALVKACGVMSMEVLIKEVTQSFQKRRFTREVIDNNIRAIKLAFEEVVSNE